MKLHPVINIGKANKKDNKLCGDMCPHLDKMQGVCFLFAKFDIKFGEGIGTELKQLPSNNYGLQYLRSRRCLNSEVK